MRALLLGGLALAALLAVGSASAQPSSPTPAPGRRRRWLLLGDSLAQGLEDGLRKRAEQSGDELRAVTANGTRAADWSGETFGELVAALRPQRVLVVLGANDAASPDASSFARAARDMAETAKRAGAILVWVDPPPLPPRLVGAGAVREALRRSVPFVVPSQDATGGRAADGVHFTPAGYDAWAGQIWTAVSRILSGP